MKEYRIMLTFRDAHTIEGMGNLTKEEAEKRIADFLKFIPNLRMEIWLSFR